VNPGFVLVMGLWYKSDEQPLRLVTYYCTIQSPYGSQFQCDVLTSPLTTGMNGFAGIFGGLLGYAIGHITTGLQQWQYIFLVFGAISLCWGVVFLIFMPDLPSTARFFNTEEKIVAVERVAVNRSGIKNHTFKWYQVWQAARDPKTWILFVMAVSVRAPWDAMFSCPVYRLLRRYRTRHNQASLPSS